MKATLYVLGGVAATLAFLGFSWLLAEVINRLFGVYGLLIEFVVLYSAAGGGAGWLIYRERQRRKSPTSL